MGIMNWIGIGKDVAEPIKAFGDLYTTDKARIEAITKLEEQLQKGTAAQLHNNAIMAAAQQLFVSGWQPLVGWTAGFLVLLYYAPQIVIMTFVWGDTCMSTGIVKPFPMKPDDILNLVWLLFGFGGYTLAKNKILGD